jgi:hypothetical protein
VKLDTFSLASFRGATHTPSVRRSFLAAAVASLALLAAGCGGSKTPSVASLGTTGQTTRPESSAQAQIKWAACIRAHGVPTFTDPNGQGQVNLAGININSPQFLAAHRACESLVPPNGGRSPAQVLQLVKQEMRSPWRPPALVDT